MANQAYTQQEIDSLGNVKVGVTIQLTVPEAIAIDRKIRMLGNGLTRHKWIVGLVREALKSS